MKMRQIKGATLFSVLAVLLLISGIYFLLHRNYVIHPVSGTSMEESLHDGDKVLIKRNEEINRYSTVAFYKNNKSDMYVKRVIGLPGDRILVQNETMIITLGKNDNFDSTIRVQLTPEIAEELNNKSVIPPNYYFVLGDNIDVSKDSRAFGLIKKNEIEGTLSLKI